MASQSDLSAANASAEPRRKLGSLRMVWQHASRYPLQLVVAAIALGIAALATLAIPYQFKEMRSEEHTSELQSLMRISYAVFCLKKKIQQNKQDDTNIRKDNEQSTLA